MRKTFIIAEIGINHNGDIKIAKQLISAAKSIGVDAVKFQKRTIEDVYSPEELDVPRESPFGTTNREQKMGLELSEEDYKEIDRFCKQENIHWFASAWDLKSQDFLKQFDLKYNKVASPMITVIPLIEKIAKEKKYTFISTGMCTLKELDDVVKIFQKYNCPFEMMHCVSTYPMKDSDANLQMILTLKGRYKCNVGFSSHEHGIKLSEAAVVLGATSIERHITLDRSMYGSDQSASLELYGFNKMIRDIEAIEKAMVYRSKNILEKEMEARNKLSKPHWWNRLTD